MELINSVFEMALRELMTEYPDTKSKGMGKNKMKADPPIEVPERYVDLKWDAFATFVTYILRQNVIKNKSPEAAADAIIHYFAHPEEIEK
jgi:hypothetical protein